MFRWNYLWAFCNFFYLEFKFHYVQMELPNSFWLFVKMKKMFKFHYVQMELFSVKCVIPISILFKFHYVQMEHIIYFYTFVFFFLFKFHYVQMEQICMVATLKTNIYCLNSTMFRWNLKNLIYSVIEEK